MSWKTYLRQVHPPVRNYYFQFPGCLWGQELETHVKLYLLNDWVFKWPLRRRKITFHILSGWEQDQGKYSRAGIVISQANATTEYKYSIGVRSISLSCNQYGVGKNVLSKNITKKRSKGNMKWFRISHLYSSTAGYLSLESQGRMEKLFNNPFGALSGTCRKKFTEWLTFLYGKDSTVVIPLTALCCALKHHEGTKKSSFWIESLPA